VRSPKYAAYQGAEPYFNLVRRALDDVVDGEHFFDGWPRIIRGRADLMAQFRGYCDNVELQSADKLMTHKADGGHTVVIEYEVHGTILRTGVQYNNRFCSIIKMENRKIAHWRDYMDSLAAWTALTASQPRQ
jgi:limonene-1,2-epoxide hydrolase